MKYGEHPMTIHLQFGSSQCLSPLVLCVRIPLMTRCSRYNIMWL